MSNTLSNRRGYVSISKAALILRVSIDTLRRWDKSGKLASYRFNGKDRYFLLDDLYALQKNKLLHIGEVAHVLHLSEATLRRMDQEGRLVASRDENGERVYCQSVIQAYWAKKREKKILHQQKQVKKYIPDFSFNSLITHSSQGFIHAPFLHKVFAGMSILLVGGMVV